MAILVTVVVEARKVADRVGGQWRRDSMIKTVTRVLHAHGEKRACVDAKTPQGKP